MFEPVLRPSHLTQKLAPERTPSSGFSFPPDDDEDFRGGGGTCELPPLLEPPTLRALARPNRPNLLSRHSDKMESNRRFNVGLAVHLSEPPLIFLANHAPLNQRVPGSSPGAPTK